MKGIMVIKRGDRLPVICLDKYLMTVIKHLEGAAKSDDIVEVYSIPNGQEVTVNMVGEVSPDHTMLKRSQTDAKSFVKNFAKSAHKEQDELSVKRLLGTPTALKVGEDYYLVSRPFYAEIGEAVAGLEGTVELYVLSEDGEWAIEAGGKLGKVTAENSAKVHDAPVEEIKKWVEQSSSWRIEVISE